ncbi:hypothetical protein Lal_00010989 [Lupinus albus]|nr:hypothetical protein Lal_00010989 [Lupinus albus]
MIDERDAQKALLRHRPVMDSSFGTDRSFILARMLFYFGAYNRLGMGPVLSMDGNSTHIRRTLTDPPNSSSEPMEDESTEIKAEADADEDGVIELVNIESSIEVIELSSDSGTEEDPTECSSTPSSALGDVYKLEIKVNHEHSCGRFVFWDRQCADMIDMSASELKNQMFVECEDDLNAFSLVLDELLAKTMVLRTASFTGEHDPNNIEVQSSSKRLRAEFDLDNNLIPDYAAFELSSSNVRKHFKTG